MMSQHSFDWFDELDVYLIDKRFRSQWIRIFSMPLLGNDPIISRFIITSSDSKKSSTLSIGSGGAKPVFAQNLGSFFKFVVPSMKSIWMLTLAFIPRDIKQTARKNLHKISIWFNKWIFLLWCLCDGRTVEDLMKAETVQTFSTI